MTLPEKLNGFVIAKSKGGGKAVKGTARTTTLQVREPCGMGGGYLLKAQFRYTVGDPEGLRVAYTQAMDWIMKQDQ